MKELVRLNEELTKVDQEIRTQLDYVGATGIYTERLTELFNLRKKLDNDILVTELYLEYNQ